MTTATVGELAQLVEGDVFGDASATIGDGRPLLDAGPEHVAFAESERNLRKLKDCNAGCVVLPRSSRNAIKSEWRPATLLFVDEPLAAFLAILARLRPAAARPEIGVSPDAIVSPNAVVGKNTNIHPGAIVEDGVVIGSGGDVHPGAVLRRGCVLGDNVVVHPNAVLYPGVIVGNNVVIHANAVLGADGFGYRLRNGRREKIPHFGCVRIEDGVEIGACSTIDRAMIGETIVGEGTKIDNLVMIAHNCELGKHNAIVGQVGFAGSVTTGDYVVCAGHVGVADHVHLGEKCIIGSKAGVHKDVPAGETYIGQPAVPAAEAMKVAMAQKKLPEALKTLRSLEAQIAELKLQILSLQQTSDAPPRAA